LILRLESPELPRTGEEVCNYKLESVGSVNNFFGPVNAPYVSIQPSAKTPSNLAGRVLYTLERE